MSSLASPAPYPSRLPGPVLPPPSFHQHSLLPLDSLKLKLCSPLYFVLLYWLSCAFISTVFATYPVLFQIQTTDFYYMAFLLSSTIQSFYSCKICNKQVKHKNFFFFFAMEPLRHCNHDQWIASAMPGFCRLFLQEQVCIEVWGWRRCQWTTIAMRSPHLCSIEIYASLFCGCHLCEWMVQLCGRGHAFSNFGCKYLP